MSDIGGFDWWFRDRDYVLRERLADVESQAYATSARSSARLSSQLSQLRGSLESRLNALSAAFDAYVELGDLREQLGAYGESAAIRRESMAAVAALGENKPAKPVDDRNSDYWIAPATNAVIARITGAPDDEAEARVRELDPAGELFLVATAGVLGHGAEVASRVPALLPAAGDTFDEHQLIIWQAVVDGVYGEGLLPVLLQDRSGELAADGADWWSWAQQQAQGTDRTTLDWIERQASTEPGPADVPDPPSNQQPGNFDPRPAQDHQAQDHQPGDQRSQDQHLEDQQRPGYGGLRQVVFGLIDAGHGDERALLSRARALRARIENPTAADPPADAEVSATAGQPGVSAVQVVRDSFLQSRPGSRAWADLRAAIAPGLLAAVEAETSTVLHQESTSSVVRVAGRSVPVTADGPDQSALAAAQQVPGLTDPANGNPRLYGFAGGAGVCILLALILAIAGVSAVLVVLLLIVGVVLGVLAGRVLLGRRAERAEHQRQQQLNTERINQAVASAQESDAKQRVAVQESAVQLDRIRAALAR